MFLNMAKHNKKNSVQLRFGYGPRAMCIVLKYRKTSYDKRI